MAMKQCPVCGEMYSDTYKECPFCEEERALQEGGGRGRRGGRQGRRTSRSRQFSLITPTLIVLIIIMAALLIYLLRGGQEPSAEDPADDVQAGDVLPDDTELVEPDGGDAEEDPAQTEDPEDTVPSGTGDDTTSEETDDTQTAESTDYEEAMALSDGLTLSTTDFTLQNLGETATIRVTAGGSGSYTWISEDDGVASVDSTGKVTAVSGGTVNVVVTDGTRKGVCIVRVRAEGSLPTAPADSSDSGSGGSHSLNNTDFTRSVSEGSYQLRVSGVTSTITWTSSDTSVATVSSTGLVTPVGPGTATVTASWDGQSLSCIVRVPG